MNLTPFLPLLGVLAILASQLQAQRLSLDDAPGANSVRGLIGAMSDPEELKATVERFRSAPILVRAGLIEVALGFHDDGDIMSIHFEHDPKETGWDERKDLRALRLLQEINGLELDYFKRNADGVVEDDDAWRDAVRKDVRVYLKGLSDGSGPRWDERATWKLADHEVEFIGNNRNKSAGANLLYQALVSYGAIGRSAKPLTDVLPPSKVEDGRIIYTFDGGFSGVSLTLLVDANGIVTGLIISGFG